MAKKDPRVDAYIAKAADFSKPILKYIRKLVHRVCPDVEETIKWNAPFYLHQGILLATPAFKKHCALIFWKGKQIGERTRLRHLTSSADLPPVKILAGYIRKAVELNEAGTKTPARARTKTGKKIIVPPYFLAALRKNKKARATFEGFSPSHKKEYVHWITGAKQEATRLRRIKTAIGWLARGKPRHWKYQS